MLKAPVSVAVAEAPRAIDEQGGTLGRGAENTWVLDDPELYLSSLHCQFIFENGRYYLIDHSTNGTFYGTSVDPMGKGTKLPVNDGDCFIIGDYEFLVSVDSQSPSLSPDPFSEPNGAATIPANDIFTAPLSQDGVDDFASNPFASGHVPSEEPLFRGEPGESDPLAAIDKARGGGAPAVNPAAASDPFAAATHSDGANSLNQQIDWPQPLTPNPGTIPDDWDLDPDDARSADPPAAAGAAAEAPRSPITEPSYARKPDHPPAEQLTPELQSRQQALAQANLKIQAELDLLKQQIDPRQQGVGSATNADTAFIDALGFAGQNLSDQQIARINQLGGEVLREMISGLMQVLGSRSSIKNEFRMNVTTIQPIENNPLKFSANVDDALENMFLKQGNAFKEPIESVREGYQGVAEHQVAILAGIREAFKAVIERFDPVVLEENFAKQNKGGLLPGSQKAKNWEAYHDYYQDLAGDIDKSFQYLFGNDFVAAYEDQLQKLLVSRKSRKFDNEK